MLDEKLIDIKHLLVRTKPEGGFRGNHKQGLYRHQMPGRWILHIWLAVYKWQKLGSRYNDGSRLLWYKYIGRNNIALTSLPYKCINIKHWK